MNVPSPGYRDQGLARTIFRVVGPLVLLAGLVLVVIGVKDLFVGVGEPENFWMAFVGMPVIFVGAVLCQFGYMGAAARYAAGEGAPVLKDTAAYLSDGEGVLGVGRTVDDAAVTGSDAAPVGGPYCRNCGQRNDVEARFCDSCGQTLA